ncbi:hypothetical protein [Actinophytocola sediminis]
MTSSVDLADAAFGTRPDHIVLATPADARQRWLAAVVLGAQGWYARAACLLDELVLGPDPLLAAFAAATLASHRRQLGGHADARRHDAAGLAGLSRSGQYLAGRPAESPPAVAEAVADLLVGLAADAVGLGRLDEARRLVAEVPAGAGWRAVVRTGWVSAEIELSAGRPAAAARHAESAARHAEESGSARHRVKSALVMGAALAADGRRARAGTIVSAAFDDATDLGLVTLQWPAAMILAELAPTQADQFCRCAALALHSVLRRADPVGRRLAGRSPWVPKLAGPTG